MRQNRIRPRRCAAAAQARSLQDLRRQVMAMMMMAAAAMLFLFVIAGTPGAQPARAADNPAPESAVTAPPDAQDIIRQQLDAIRNRDPAAAYALMTHDYHELHGDPLQFFSTMRFENRAIYNHKDFTFLDPQGTGSGAAISIQKIRIQSHHGDPVIVLYRMERQDDGTWLIDSFAVLAPDAQPI